VDTDLPGCVVQLYIAVSKGYLRPTPGIHPQILPRRPFGKLQAGI
jgi:hypothetical protein